MCGYAPPDGGECVALLPIAPGRSARYRASGKGRPVGPTLEQQARAGIDRLLTAAGWSVQDVAQANIHAARGVALREFPEPFGVTDGFQDVST